MKGRKGATAPSQWTRMLHEALSESSFGSYRCKWIGGEALRKESVNSVCPEGERCAGSSWHIQGGGTQRISWIHLPSLCADIFLLTQTEKHHVPCCSQKWPSCLPNGPLMVLPHREIFYPIRVRVAPGPPTVPGVTLQVTRLSSRPVQPKGRGRLEPRQTPVIPMIKRHPVLGTLTQQSQEFPCKLLPGCHGNTTEFSPYTPHSREVLSDALGMCLSPPTSANFPQMQGERIPWLVWNFLASLCIRRSSFRSFSLNV